MQCKFILSLNAAPAVRQTFRQFEIRAVTTTYATATPSNQKGKRELLIANFDFL